MEMNRVSVFATGVILVLATAGCGAHRQTVLLPPRIDLTLHEMIGVVEFRSPQNADLGDLATRRFCESARRDQGLVRMLEFGPEQEALRAVGQEAWGPAAVKALGQEHGVRTVLRGELVISEIRPEMDLAASLRAGTLSARIDASLAVQLVEAATGASLWNRSASASQTIGHLTVAPGGKIDIGANDPERAYGPLVDQLVAQVTRDFHATWQRR